MFLDADLRPLEDWAIFSTWPSRWRSCWPAPRRSPQPRCNEDYRARWTDPARVCRVQKTIDDVGNDEEKLAAHFDNDAARCRRFKTNARNTKNTASRRSIWPAVAAAEQDAQRVVELASSPAGIPKAGAVSLLRSDPKTQGPKLFARYCASCHAFQARATEVADDDKIHRAQLVRLCQSRDWIAGLLDPKKIAGPEYFGNTSHNEGDMVYFVTDTLRSGRPMTCATPCSPCRPKRTLPVRPMADKKDAAAIEAGRKVIANEENCASCHKFRRRRRTGTCPRPDRLRLARVAIGDDQRSQSRTLLRR